MIENVKERVRVRVGVGKRVYRRRQRSGGERDKWSGLSFQEQCEDYEWMIVGVCISKEKVNEGCFDFSTYLTRRSVVSGLARHWGKWG